MTAVVVQAPGSKSVTHRAYVLGALSAVPCRVEGGSTGADCRSTLGALAALGAQFVVEGDVVAFEPATWAGGGVLDCGNSGTTLRLLMGQAARLAAPVRLVGDRSLEARPNGPLVAALRGLGAQVEAEDGRAPVVVRGPIEAGEVALPARTSSQFASSLMLALAQCAGESVVRLAAPVASRPYLAVTEAVAAAFGVRFEVVTGEGGLVIRVPGGQRPAATGYRVEGDWSGAAFPLVAGAVLGRAVAVEGLRRDSAQGDRAVAEVVGRFGASVEWVGELLRVEPGALRAPAPVDVGATPDLFPPLCALAACSEGTTVLYGAPGLRDKECDRIAAMAAGLSALGVRCRERADGIEIEGGPIGGGAVASHDDHRVHMAFSILAAVAGGGVEVDGRGCEAVSYPAFHADLARISAGRAF